MNPKIDDVFEVVKKRLYYQPLKPLFKKVFISFGISGYLLIISDSKSNTGAEVLSNLEIVNEP